MVTIGALKKWQFLMPLFAVVSGMTACGGGSESNYSDTKVLPVALAATISDPVPGGRMGGIPVGIRNVNDSPLKASNERVLLRFVPVNTITINRFYFGFKLKGANCRDPGQGGYGAGDGGMLRATLVEIDPATGLPGTAISNEIVNGCVRHQEASAEANGATPVLVWVNTPGTLQANTMYGVIVQNVHANPASNFFSFNAPIADTVLAGPHTRNELNGNAASAIMSLDPREHIAWSADSGSTWQYGSLNGPYRSYMDYPSTAHPATRIPQYGFRLADGTRIGAQPYYAYNTICTNCTVAYANARYSRTFTELGGFIVAGTDVGTLTITNTNTGATSSCTPAAGYGNRICTLPTPISVAAGESYTIRSTGSVELMRMDWQQRQVFSDIGTANGTHRAYQPTPMSGTTRQDMPSLWAGPLSAYYN